MFIRLNYLLLVLYCGFIFWLSDQHKLPTPDWFSFEDKMHHLLAYFLMGVLFWRAFLHRQLRTLSLFLLTVGFCTLYGLSDEFHQSFVEGRTSSALDLLADFLGGLLAGGLGYWYSGTNSKVGRLVFGGN